METSHTFVNILRPLGMNMPATSTSDNQENPLEQRMARLRVRASDLEERFVRSGGRGGQNVNKTSTCVMLRHVPSGLMVKCQATREQGQNRQLALEWLLDKIEAQRTRERAATRARIEKAKRQKRGRSRAAKLRILADKARRSEKKAQRRRVSGED